MQAVYRIIDYKLKEYENSVRSDIEIDSGFDLYQLKRRLGILRHENIFLSYIEEGVFKKLFDAYLRGEDLHKLVYTLDLYYPHHKEMAEEGVLSETTVEIPLKHKRYEITDQKQFREIARTTVRQFLWVAFWLERRNLMLNYASDIERNNKVLSPEIIEAIEKLRRKVPSYKEKSSVEKTENRLISLEPQYMSFYSKKMRQQRLSDVVLILSQVKGVFKFMVSNNFLSEDYNNEKHLLDLFTEKKLSKKRPIRWMGSPNELKVFTNLIAETAISEAIKPRKPEKWEIVKHCFHVKLKGKEMGPIVNKTSISGAKPKKTDKVDEIKDTVDKIKEILS